MKHERYIEIISRMKVYNSAPLNLLIQPLLVLLYATTSLAVPLDFQVGNYLHQFFKDFLPNNTNYKRRPDHEEPYKKYYSKIHSTHTSDNLPTIEGLTFKMAGIEFPTLPFGNLTMGVYNPRNLSTLATTPSKENLLQMGNLLGGIIMKKSGIMKDIAGAYKEYQRVSSTYNPGLADVFDNYDERIHKIMHRVRGEMEEKVDILYNRTAVPLTTTTANVIQCFMKEMKKVYNEQIKSIFVKTTEQTTEKSEEATYFKVDKSQEMKDAENLRQLGQLDNQFINKTDLERELKDIYTPGPHEKF